MYWPGANWPGFSETLCVPGARVAPETPFIGSVRLRPEARHQLRTSVSHFLPPFSLLSVSYQIASVLAGAPAFSSQTAT